MIVDSSAVIAILRAEPEAADLAIALVDAPRRRIAAPTALEIALVEGPDRYEQVDVLLASGEIEIVPFDAEQMRVAREAHARYGCGSGSPARLNFGDCISYALAKSTGEPLLFKGEDFAHTDVVPAV